MVNLVPNINEMTSDEALSFWAKHQGGRNAKELFPGREPGYVRNTGSLAHYAANKGAAVLCRLAGNIKAALVYEAIADGILSRMDEGFGF